jgi:HTH-type transcriptional repressor of NAD biosynthesis genes
VPEVARELITSNEFSVEDIIRIGHAQAQRIHDKSITANKVLFCDTDVITTQVYSRHYLNVIPPVLYELEKQVHYDQYFLFDADVPWVADDLRDLGDRRKEMYAIFKKELEQRNQSYIPVHGSWAQREEIVRKTIDQLVMGK